MYKSIKRGNKLELVKTGRILDLTEEDRKTIREIFAEFANVSLIKEEGVWRQER